MVIKDEELRTLFRAESEEHLQHLDEGLLRLESNPSEIANIEALFREAHSLKGAAQMLGVTDVERIAHRFEDVLGSAKRGETPIGSAMVDRMYHALDAIRKLVTQAVTGAPSGIDVDRVIRRFDEESAHSDTVEPSNRIPSAAQPAASFDDTHRMQTIRVESHKLDALMTQTGELIVTKTRIAHRAVEADLLVTLWEEWTRFQEKERLDKLGTLLYQLRDGIHEDNSRLEFAANRVDEGVRDVRLLPFSTIFSMFPRAVRDVANELQKEVQIVIQGGATVADKRVLEEMKDPLMHMIRNAVDHGIETPSEREKRGKPRLGTIRLTAVRRGPNVVIELSDDGQGLSVDSIKSTALKKRIVTSEELDRMTIPDLQALIFRAGFSTSAVITDLSGRGVGLDVVRTNVERLKGTISVESIRGAGCTVRIQLPATLVTSRVLVVDVQGRAYGLPLEYVESTRLLTSEDIFTIEGRRSIVVDSKPASIVRLVDLLELRSISNVSDTRPGERRRQPCVIISAGDEMVGLIVDQLLDEQEVIMKRHGGLLKRVRNVAGSAVLVTGVVCTVLNPPDLIRSVRKGVVPLRADAAIKDRTRQTILLVEDSITTRTWEKRGLEDAGYDVVTAVNGIEALGFLGSQAFDAVVSDIQMPGMDGLTLTERIRQNKRYKELPVILVTSLADDADKKRGIDAGANAYITKSSFDQKLLVETLKRLV